METSANSTRSSWIFLATVVFVVNVANLLYALNGTTPSESFYLVSQVALIMSLWYWFLQYSRKHRISWPLDMGLFFAAAGFIIIPCYVLRVERRRGLITLGALLGLYLGAYIFATSLYYIITALRSTG